MLVLCGEFYNTLESKASWVEVQILSCLPKKDKKEKKWIKIQDR